MLTSCQPIAEPAIVLENVIELPVAEVVTIPEPQPELEPFLVPAPGDVSGFPRFNSRAVFMYNFETDTVVLAQNEHIKLPPASIAKIMTCLVILETVPYLDALVQVTDEAFAPFESGDPNMDDAATAGIEPGQSNVKYIDCIFGLMLPSGCEAANILAYNGGNGSMDVFVDMMNAKARDIGAVNTNFTNASGLYEDGFYTTAYDMFLITKYAMDNHPLFMQIAAFDTYVMPANVQFPRGYLVGNANNRLATHFDFPYAAGIKIGQIYEYFVDGVRLDGFSTLVTFAEKDGMSYLLVTLGAEYYNEDRRPANNHFADHYMLYNWAFETFSLEYK